MLLPGANVGPLIVSVRRCCYASLAAGCAVSITLGRLAASVAGVGKG